MTVINPSKINELFSRAVNFTCYLLVDHSRRKYVTTAFYDIIGSQLGGQRDISDDQFSTT